jgi:hypothetical protein
MPEGIGYSGSNVVAGTGLELNYIGNHCYAYSGAVDTGAENVKITALNFTSGNGYIMSSFQFHNNQTTGDDIHFELTLNGVVVFGISMQYSGTDKLENPPTAILIPPYTNVQVTVANATQAAARETLTTMTGKVYK